MTSPATTSNARRLPASGVAAVLLGLLLVGAAFAPWYPDPFGNAPDLPGWSADSLVVTWEDGAVESPRSARMPMVFGALLLVLGALSLWRRRAVPLRWRLAAAAGGVVVLGIVFIDYRFLSDVGLPIGIGLWLTAAAGLGALALPLLDRRAPAAPEPTRTTGPARALRPVPGERWRALVYVAVGLLILYPFFPVLDVLIEGGTGESLKLDRQMVSIFIFAILALALNVQVGYAGLLQLGIIAFFAIGAITTGIFTVDKYPFQFGFWGALLIAPAMAGVAGIALGLPTLRLRGDYLAIVTLGFGEVVRVVLINWENITDGPRGLNPLPPPYVPAAAGQYVDAADLPVITLYYVSLGLLAVILVLLRNLERSRLGRALVALREDELAASCMGMNPARTKLMAFAIGAAIAGMAGCLYATNLTTTAEPNTYDFNYSIMVLCCLIIGGLGSLRGALLGATVLLGWDNVISPLLTRLLQREFGGDSGNVFTQLSNWKWLLFGLVLVLMMRFRPEGLWPSSRVKREMHHEEGE